MSTREFDCAICGKKTSDLDDAYALHLEALNYDTDPEIALCSVACFLEVHRRWLERRRIVLAQLPDHFTVEERERLRKALVP